MGEEKSGRGEEKGEGKRERRREREKKREREEKREEKRRGREKREEKREGGKRLVGVSITACNHAKQTYHVMEKDVAILCDLDVASTTDKHLHGSLWAQVA